MFKDPRDGCAYKTVIIGELEWLTENLRFNHPKSFVY
jgi:uncharacterized protein (TIGR02145 family)